MAAGFSNWSHEHENITPGEAGVRGYYFNVKLSSWARRVPGAVIDYGIWFGLLCLTWNTTVVLFYLVPTIFLVANNLMQGQTGQSFGKRLTGLVLFQSRWSHQEGKFVPTWPGAFLCLGRLVAHLVDHAVYIGWLRPLWHWQRRTWADSICHTYVARVGDVRLRPADGPVDR